MSTATTTEKEGSGWLTGSFRDRESSEGAYKSLRDRGYSDDDINVLMSDETRNKWYGKDEPTELGSKAPEGAVTGGLIGGTLGAIAAGIAAIGTNLVLPGLGLIVWGPIAAALAGAGAGGATGGIIGALVGYGIPEEHARLYEEDVKNGGAVIGVKPRNDEDATYLENDWRTNYKGEHVYR
jgi:hypothetical protein